MTMDEKGLPDSVDTFEEFVTLVENVYRQQDYQRRGQVYYNLFSRYFPQRARVIIATELDPYHLDGNIPDFLKVAANVFE